MTSMRVGLALSALVVAPVLVQAASLRGYVFREFDGGPPRLPLTIELAQGGKVRYRKTTRFNGSFEFTRVAEGRYTITPRFGKAVFVQDFVVVSSTGPNFAAIMLPKRRAGASRLGTISFDMIRIRGDRKGQKKYEQAQRLLKAGDFAGAIKLYEEIVESSPLAEIFDALALLYLRQGRKEEAYWALQIAIARDPQFLFSYVHLASLYLEERRYKEAAEIAMQALRVDPYWSGAHLLLSEAHIRLGDMETAARHLRTANEIVRGRSPDPYLLWARVHWSRGDCGQARQQLQRYLGLFTSARAIQELENPIKAIETCR